MDGYWATLRATVAARLPRQHWPQRTVLMTAVNTPMGNRWWSTARAESRRLRAGAGALPLRRQNAASAGLRHPSRCAARRTARGRQQSRNEHPGQQPRGDVRRQCDGSIDASSRDPGSFVRLHDLGLELLGQQFEPGRAVLAYRVIDTDEFPRRCSGCGCQAERRGLRWRWQASFVSIRAHPWSPRGSAFRVTRGTTRRRLWADMH